MYECTRGPSCLTERPIVHEPTLVDGLTEAQQPADAHDAATQGDTPGHHHLPHAATAGVARSSTRGAFPFPACLAPRLIEPPDPNADPAGRSRPICWSQRADCPLLTRSRLPRAAPRRPPISSLPAAARHAINLRPLPARRLPGSRYQRKG
jgi:hypothetical protein